MPKKKERSELEFLRAENRKLRSELRHIKKEVSRKVKREHLYTDLEERLAEQHVEDLMEDNHSVRRDLCPECSNSLESIPLGNRIMINCTACKFRTSKKICLFSLIV